MLLLDTNVVSYIFKKDSRADFYTQQLQGHGLVISFMTLGELYQWPMERGWGQSQIEKLQRLIDTLVLAPVDDSLVRTWASLVIENKQQGTPRDFPDSWIAATALRYDLTLVTHNRRHFEGIQGLRIISDN